MDLIATMEGDLGYYEFGALMTSIDFNGDGYQDLVINSGAWNPFSPSYNSAQLYGKLFFYWGGPDFDIIPDYELEGRHIYHFGGHSYQSPDHCMINGGDMNGDGYEDIVLTGNGEDASKRIMVYFGRANPLPDMDADIELIYPQSGNPMWINALGDVNGDGLDDISIMRAILASTYNLIWTDVYAQPIVYQENQQGSTLFGAGDVNNDGYDDMICQYIPDGANPWSRFILFYGDAQCSMSDSLFLGPPSEEAVSLRACSVGDINNDGYSDFFAWSKRFWLGSTNIQAAPSFMTNPMVPQHEWYSLDLNAPPTLVTGDLNNDGYGDFVGSSCPTANGEVGIWLGGANPNGLIDLYIHQPANYEYRNFGWSKAMGDFNADGIAELAIGAPFWGDGSPYDTMGKVFLYAGNILLADTTVANEDELAPELSNSPWEISTYPNPQKSLHNSINVAFTGTSYKHIHKPLQMELYNLKGQLVMTCNVDNTTLKQGTTELGIEGFAAGVYIIKISDGSTNLTTHRFTIY